VVKARVVRQKTGASAPLSAHLRYLRRYGVSKEGEPARMFDADGQDCDSRAFAKRCEGDPHHFRFIVSPDDALEMTDLRAFPCDLMTDMERDLGTNLTGPRSITGTPNFRTSILLCAAGPMTAGTW
jgi:type IV secretory pathway VirD2 relaxase